MVSLKEPSLNSWIHWCEFNGSLPKHLPKYPWRGRMAAWVLFCDNTTNILQETDSCGWRTARITAFSSSPGNHTNCICTLQNHTVPTLLQGYGLACLPACQQSLFLESLSLQMLLCSDRGGRGFTSGALCVLFHCSVSGTMNGTSVDKTWFSHKRLNPALSWNLRLSYEASVRLTEPTCCSCTVWCPEPGFESQPDAYQLRFCLTATPQVLHL